MCIIRHTYNTVHMMRYKLRLAQTDWSDSWGVSYSVVIKLF